MPPSLPTSLTILLARLRDLVSERRPLEHRRRYRPADGDIVLTSQPDSGDVFALVLTADSSVAAVERVPDASPDQLLTSGYVAAADLAGYLPDLPDSEAATRQSRTRPTDQLDDRHSAPDSQNDQG